MQRRILIWTHKSENWNNKSDIFTIQTHFCNILNCLVCEQWSFWCVIMISKRFVLLVWGCFLMFSLRQFLNFVMMWKYRYHIDMSLKLFKVQSICFHCWFGLRLFVVWENQVEKHSFLVLNSVTKVCFVLRPRKIEQTLWNKGRKIFI